MVAWIQTLLMRWTGHGSTAARRERMTIIVDVDRDAVKAGLADGSLVLVDVREPHEFAAGHVPGAVNLPLSAFDASLLPQDGPMIVFSCAAGIRSAQAVALAHRQGVHVNRHYPGGMRDWVMAGEPVER
jgi:rhodanese-related sulfurtransferase